MTPNARDPIAVRTVRGVIAVLVWGALSFPIGGMFRWVGEVLAMPPSYEPTWKLFVVAVAVVLFLAFVLEPHGHREVDTRDVEIGEGGGPASDRD